MASSFAETRNRKSHHPAPALSREDMPTDYAISIAAYTGEHKTRVPDNYGPIQRLTGFDPEYRNIVDYIVRVTYRIWETDARDVDYIGEVYAPDSIVFDDFGLQRGSAKIIGDTYHTTGAYPDITLDAEEVIWAGDDETGIHTSHLARIVGTNTAPSNYGPAEGATIRVMAIANCVTKGNDIFLEHVLYNTSSMLKQLGKDLWKEADRLVRTPPPGWPRSAEVWAELRKSGAPARPLSEADPVEGFDPDAFARRIHDSVWNDDMAVIGECYAPDVVFEGATGREFQGTDAYRVYFINLRTAFPAMTVQVDEVYWMGNDAEGWRISTRWSADADHSGAGIYGDPTGQRCQIWGITQWHVKDGKITKEAQLFNELDLMMQIVHARIKASRTPG